jgi:hypothetical protein
MISLEEGAGEGVDNVTHWLVVTHGHDEDGLQSSRWALAGRILGLYRTQGLD